MFPILVLLAFMADKGTGRFFVKHARLGFMSASVLSLRALITHYHIFINGFDTELVVDP